MNQLARVLSVVETCVFAGVGLIAVLRWYRRRGATRWWLAATFGALGLVLVIAQFLPPASRVPSLWVVKPVLALIVIFPYCLYRFMNSFEPAPRWLHVAAAGITGLLLAATAAIPRLPAVGQPQPGYLRLFALLFAAQWILLAGAVAVRLWRAGKGQPTLARRRMRTLSAASALLAVVAVLSASITKHSTDATLSGIVLTVLAIASGPLFLAGFAPPQLLIRVWRRQEEQALQSACVDLMSATDPRQAVEGLLPQLVSIVAAQGAAVYDGDGTLLGAHGPVPAEATLAPEAGRAAGRTFQQVRLTFPNATLAVWASPYTPYFGRGELDLLNNLGVMASLALERCRMFQRERSALEALEEAQRIARIGSWRWVPGTETIAWSHELFRIHGQDPATFRPTIAALQEVCHPEDRDRRAAEIRAAAASNTPFEMEYRIHLPDGRVRTLHGLGKVNTATGGGPCEVIGTIQDVTEQRRLEAVRNEFIANAAHELRTPLTTLTGMAMLLATRRHQLSDATLGEAFEALGRQGERARVLINNMLDLSQLDAQRIPITMEQVPLATVVRRAQEAVVAPAGKEVEISVPEPLSALADPARLEQVITNLLSNAYRYGGRHVCVEAHRAGGRVLLSVTDDGPGVPDDLVASLFEPFTRGQAVTGTVGSGLGLAISRRLVDAFQGRMSYECRTPHGARFLVELQEAA